MSLTLTDVLSPDGITLKPEQIGETLGGTITATEVRQGTDYTTGKPDFWDDGKPKHQIVVTVDTGGKTAEGDDKLGNIYIKVWGKQRTALMKAIKDTGLDADAALAAGNEFWVTFTDEKPNEKNPRFNATKLYEYRIVPRANVAGALADTTPAPAAPAAPATVAPPTPAAPAAAPAAAAPAAAAATPADTARQLIAQGLDDASIAMATNLDPTVIQALRGQ